MGWSRLLLEGVTSALQLPPAVPAHVCGLMVHYTMIAHSSTNTAHVRTALLHVQPLVSDRVPRNAQCLPLEYSHIAPSYAAGSFQRVNLCPGTSIEMRGCVAMQEGVATSQTASTALLRGSGRGSGRGRGRGRAGVAAHEVSNFRKPASHLYDLVGSKRSYLLTMPHMQQWLADEPRSCSILLSGVYRSFSNWNSGV